MPDAQTRNPVTLSREELYALVWATPMSRLAIQYGLSGNGLAKICRRLDVPYPPRGYWARKEENEWRRDEEEMRRYNERQRQQLERNRLRGFLELASRWKEVEAARLFLDALAKRAASNLDEVLDDRTVGEWIAWARERLTAHDPLETGAAAVFRAVAAISQWTYRVE